MLKKFIAIILSALLIAVPVNADYVSNPGNIPLLDNYATPLIKPSENGIFRFTIQNRYTEDMVNVSLKIEIHLYATIKERKNIEYIGNAPKFVEDDRNINIIAKDKFAISTFYLIPKNATKEIKVMISTDSSTPQGTYFIRGLLEFSYEGKRYVMKSRGHFTNEEWSKIENRTYSDKINYTYLESLGVKAIIPESSFTVKEPFPIWVLYVLIGIASFFLFMAIVFYIRDERRRK